MILPWHNQQWQQIMHARQLNRLPHALLLKGVAGVGKAHFADCLIRVLLCQQAFETTAAQLQRIEACQGESLCHACRLVQGRVHPNVLWIEPEKGVIKIDQIRSASEFASQSALQGDLHFIIIHPASAMNVNAANALLKTLEEPASGAMLILLCDQDKHLPATILSRCQHIHFTLPARNVAEAWLKQELGNEQADLRLLLNLANGAPLTVLQLLADDRLHFRKQLFSILQSLTAETIDPVNAAKTLLDMELLPFIDFSLSWLLDLIRLNVEANEMINTDYKQPLEAASQKMPLALNIELMTTLQQIRQQILSGINFNKQLMMETILIQWSQAICS